MKYKELIENYHGDLNNLTIILKSMVDSYRLLIAGAAELNNINEAKTSQVKDAVKRADKLGESIDRLIKLIDNCGESYFNYCSILNDYILQKSDAQTILTEIEDELLLQNSTIRIESENEEEI